MKIVNDIKEMQELSQSWRKTGEKIAFVPTMGSLHSGHISLVNKAVEDATRIVVSIFVNPLQFNEEKDFKSYPRTIEKDLEKLENNKVDIVFIPNEADLYPVEREFLTIVDVQKITQELEGEHRPGHFCGVTTVVTKLFNIVQAHFAVFGEKDFQQLLVIRRMVRDLNMPINILSMPTLRESDGLAMSSRNRRLSHEERCVAPKLYEILTTIREKIISGGGSMSVLEGQALADLSAAGFVPEYFSIRNSDDLSQPRAGQSLVIVAAAWLGNTRLIDNLKI